MSRHVSRRERWASHGADQYRSVDNLVVRRYKGEWWADVAYELLGDEAPGELARWERHQERIGPFRRPRNAMVEAERQVVSLRNRHGERVRLVRVEGGPVG